MKFFEINPPARHLLTFFVGAPALNWNVAFFIHGFSYTKESLGSPNKYHKHSIKITLARACFCHIGFLHIFRFVVVSDNGACTCPQIIWCMHLNTKRLCHLKKWVVSYLSACTIMRGNRVHSLPVAPCLCTLNSSR